MDSIVPLGLPSATLRLYESTSAKVHSADLTTVTGLAQVDSVTIAGAIEPSPSFNEIPFDLYSDLPGERLPPSLASLLEEIKKYLQETLQQLREEQPEFFKRLSEARERLENVKGGGQLESLGALVGSVEPGQADAFLLGVENLVEAIRAKEGGPPKGRLEVSNVRLGLRISSAKGLEMAFEKVELLYTPPAKPAPALRLAMSNGAAALLSI